MSHNYLLDLNQHIDARVTALTEALQQKEDNLEEHYRNRGRLEVLKKFQSMLCRQYYPKLPKRLYRKLAVATCESMPPEM